MLLSKETRHEYFSEPLMYYFVFEWEEEEGDIYSVKFKVYSVKGVELNGQPKLYISHLNDGGQKYTLNPEEAEPFLTGNQRWDGCVNYQMTPGHHTCEKAGRDNFIGAIFYVTDQAATILNRPEEWDG